jgi:hypothetical protein
MRQLWEGPRVGTDRWAVRGAPSGRALPCPSSPLGCTNSPVINELPDLTLAEVFEQFNPLESR